MSIEEIRQLIKNSNVVLVLDNGEPSFVVLDYKVYKDMIISKDEKAVALRRESGNGKSQHEREAEILDRLNKEILALKNQIEMEERGTTNPHIDPTLENRL